MSPSFQTYSPQAERKPLRIAALILMLSLTAPLFAQTQDLPLEGEAYSAADEAYKAFNRGEYKYAEGKAREALTSRPDVLRLHLLLIDVLIATNDIAHAREEIEKARHAFAPKPEIEARQTAINQRLAHQFAAEAYAALQNKNINIALTSAQRAVGYMPNDMSYRLLLLNAQLVADRLSDALETASAAIALDSQNYVPLVWRGYIHQRLGKLQAGADFNAALAINKLTDDERKNIRIIAADAALASGDHARAKALLRDYVSTDPRIIPRLEDAEAMARGKGMVKSNSMSQPIQNCRTATSGVVCSLEPAFAQIISEPLPNVPDKLNESYEAATRAYEAERQRNYDLAVTEARKAIVANKADVSNHLLFVNLLNLAKRPDEAEAAATVAITGGMARGELYALRGFARHQLHKYAGALSDWEMALELGVPGDQSRVVRLGIADAALSLKQPLRALRAIEKMPQSYEVLIRRGYAFEALGRKEEALAAFTLAARSRTTLVQRGDALRAEINVLVQLDRKAEARALFDKSLAQGLLKSINEA
ncbi:MAG TPA: hypothetical protein VHN11_02695, partial [Xanthobacteraceae bacterium]|nr:hypothetical protein [Xanthobacteraceae bacterium]